MSSFFKVALVSLPGKGKTYSTRTLNRETTGFINVENKPLPYRGGYKHYAVPKNHEEVMANIIEMGKNPEIDCLVIDSFSAYTELLLGSARKQYRNFDIWNYYNERVGQLLDLIKKVPKHVFVIAHYEFVGIEGSQEKRIKIKGREWEGMVEKEFTIVLYADRKLVEDKDGKHVEAWFDLALDNSSSKCPPDLFGEQEFRIPNDASYVLEKIKEYVK